MIEVEDLACRFGTFEAVKGISFRVAPGEIFAFLGPNGAGKTTTIKMLTTLLRATRGSIRIDGLLKQFELWDKRDVATAKYSGGMKRRLEIVRGFLHTPKVLFLDEPTLGLDPQSRHQLWNHVRAVNEAEGVTVFLTTHYMDEAERVAHRIAIVDHGGIVALGTLAELKAQTGTESLEAAFLKLTGTTVRDEAASNADRMRQFMQAWRR